MNSDGAMPESMFFLSCAWKYSSNRFFICPLNLRLTPAWSHGWKRSVAQAGRVTLIMLLSFSFAASVLPPEEVEMTYQRYVDADLASVGPDVSLEARYGELDRPGFWTWALGLAVAAGVIVGLRRLLASLRQAPEQARYIVPEDLSAFTVIGLLRQIESSNGLSQDSRDELNGQITKIESHYFGDEEATSPDLGEIARSWVQRVT